MTHLSIDIGADDVIDILPILRTPLLLPYSCLLSSLTPPL